MSRDLLPELDTNGQYIEVQVAQVTHKNSVAIRSWRDDARKPKVDVELNLARDTMGNRQKEDQGKCGPTAKENKGPGYMDMGMILNAFFTTKIGFQVSHAPETGGEVLEQRSSG